MSQYLMESETEGARIRKKTELATTLKHLSVTGLAQGMCALDAGCASGDVTREIAKIVYPAATVGLDMSMARIKESRAIDRELGQENIEYVKSNVYGTGIDSNQFDFIWARFLFEYLKEPLKAVLELKRMAKPGGKVVAASIDGYCNYHHPIGSRMLEEIDEVIDMLNQKAGFDPFAGRKLYHSFYKAGFNHIDVNIFPYHEVIGEPTHEKFLLWEEKIRFIEQKYRYFAPDQYEKRRPFFDAFLEFLKRPDTLTYSVIFIVQGIKPE